MKFKVSPSLIYKFEGKLDGGTTFIYNLDTGSILIGNRLIYAICKNILEYKQKNEIILYLMKEYGINKKDAVKAVESAILNKILLPEE